MTDKSEMLSLLGFAKHEIIELRRRNEILSAKVEMIDLFACVLHTKAAEQRVGAAEDVAWALEREMSNIRAEITDDT